MSCDKYLPWLYSKKKNFTHCFKNEFSTRSHLNCSRIVFGEKSLVFLQFLGFPCSFKKWKGKWNGSRILHKIFGHFHVSPVFFKHENQKLNVRVASKRGKTPKTYNVGKLRIFKKISKMLGICEFPWTIKLHIFTVFLEYC